MSFPMYDADALRTAVILTDRPEVGADSFLASAHLPSTVWLRANVVGVGAVRCAIEPSAITTLSAHRAPTWGDLESVWQTLAEVIDGKIRRSDFDLSIRHRDRLPVVSVTSSDVRHHAQQPLSWRGHNPPPEALVDGERSA